jgi:hypothetical protein
LPALKAPVLTLHGRSHQGTTQNGHHFPLAHEECVIHRQGDRVLRLVERVEENGWVMTGHIGARWQHGDGPGCRVRFAIWRHGHGSDKAITLAVARLNETLRLSVIANGVAYSLETVFNRGIAHSLS